MIFSPIFLFTISPAVGDDKRADEYLHELEDNLESMGARTNIVDVMSHKWLASSIFSSVIRKSLK